MKTVKSPVEPMDDLQASSSAPTARRMSQESELQVVPHALSQGSQPKVTNGCTTVTDEVKPKVFVDNTNRVKCLSGVLEREESSAAVNTATIVRTGETARAARRGFAVDRIAANSAVVTDRAETGEARAREEEFNRIRR